MRNIHISRLLGVVLFSSISMSAADHDAKTVEMKNAQGESVGTVKVTQTSSGTQFELNLSKLPPGKHAIHIHEAAKCDGPDFKTAGAHFNPAGKQHGLKNPMGPHAGDFPNFTVNSLGEAKTVVKGGKATLADHGDHAIIIHAKEDDMKSDPAGNAGDRIACGIM
jgi:Cu-Zn family superoxide dismutase